MDSWGGRRRRRQPPEPVTGKTYLRKMNVGMIQRLCQELDAEKVNNMDWRGVVSRIKDPDGYDRYGHTDIQVFENQFRMGRSPMQAVFNDWMTSNATVQDLVDILKDMDMLSVIDIIFPQEEERRTGARPVQETRHTGVIDQPGETYHSFVRQKEVTACIGSSYDHSDMNHRLSPSGKYGSREDEVSSSTAKEPCESGFDPIEQSELPPMPRPSDPVQEYRYEDLVQMTEDFNPLPVNKGGRLIGEGGFGTVFKGTFRGINQFCAVKRLRDEVLNDEMARKQFTAEYKTLSKLQHANLVKLYGFSFDGPSYCLVFQYLVNGCLNARLACQNGTPPLDWRTRVRIAQGAAEGICFLHQQGYIHRDIKSANILLDENFTAKIGDFGLVRAMPDNKGTMMTTKCIGTPVYMPPEARSGEITIKWDSFSFGVVLLELMTGLPAVDNDRENADIISYVNYQIECEQTEFIKLMDARMEHNFAEDGVTLMYSCASKLLEDIKQKRPEMKEVMNTLMRC